MCFKFPLFIPGNAISNPRTLHMEPKVSGKDKWLALLWFEALEEIQVIADEINMCFPFVDQYQSANMQSNDLCSVRHDKSKLWPMKCRRSTV